MNPFRILALLCICLLASAAHAVPTREVTAQETARKWLALIDDGKYAAAHAQTAPIFQEEIAQKDWREALDKARKPLGKVLERTLKSLFFTDELPDAPPGNYVVVQFETQFENREEKALETITPMWLELDEATGEWRVAGYYIK